MSLAGTIQKLTASAAKRYGSSAVITRSAPGAYSASTGANVTGTITTGLSVKGANAAGVSSVVCTTAATTGECALQIGDFVTFAGDTQEYALSASAVQAGHASDVTLAIVPPLKVALVGGEAVTVHASISSACYVTPDAASGSALGFKFGQGLIQAGDVQFDLPNKGLKFVPSAGDKITATLDGVSSTFTVISVQPNYFMGVATDYSLLVRK